MSTKIRGFPNTFVLIYALPPCGKLAPLAQNYQGARFIPRKA